MTFAHLQFWGIGEFHLCISLPSLCFFFFLSLRSRVTCLRWWSRCFHTTSGLWLPPPPHSKASSSPPACPTSQVYGLRQTVPPRCRLMSCGRWGMFWKLAKRFSSPPCSLQDRRIGHSVNWNVSFMHFSKHVSGAATFHFHSCRNIQQLLIILFAPA